MTSYKDFKKLSKNSARDALKARIDQEQGSNRDDDPRFWRPTTDKAGNGSAVIRFLPTPPGEEFPWVKVYSHSFQGPGGWYIENSRTTINEPDPVGDANSILWNSGRESDKDIARKRSRRTHFIMNILVLKDPGAPANEGQVRLFRIGKKIFEKIQDKIAPQFPDEVAFSPFDFQEGADFKLKVCKVDNFPNYDKSEFAAPKPLFDGDDDKLEALWQKLYPLLPFLDPSNFKSYDALKSRYDKVMGQLSGATSNGSVEVRRVIEDRSSDEDDDDDDEDEADESMRVIEKLAQRVIED